MKFEHFMMGLPKINSMIHKDSIGLRGRKGGRDKHIFFM
jgi:hypothetical protein